MRRFAIALAALGVAATAGAGEPAPVEKKGKAAGDPPAAPAARGAEGARAASGATALPAGAAVPVPRVVVRTATGELLGPLLSVEGSSALTFVLALGRPMSIGIDGTNPGTLYYESGNCTGVPLLEAQDDYYKVVSIGSELWARAPGMPIQSLCANSMRANSTNCNPPTHRCNAFVAAEPLRDPRHPYAMPLRIAAE